MATRVQYQSPNFGQAKHGQKGPAATFRPKGVCSPMYISSISPFMHHHNISLPFWVAGWILESLCICGQFLLSGNHFSASYKALEFCWQIALNSPQHLRPCHTKKKCTNRWKCPNPTTSYFTLPFSIHACHRSGWCRSTTDTIFICTHGDWRAWLETASPTQKVCPGRHRSWVGFWSR